MTRIVKCLMASMALLLATAPAAAKRAELRALPEWNKPAKPPKKPAAVSGKERTQGVYAFRFQGTSIVSTISPTNTKDEMQIWTELNSRALVPKTCLVMESSSQGSPPSGAMQSIWEPGVHDLRIETLRHTGKKTAEIEISRFWFDSRTHGTKVFERKTEPLLEIARGPGGVRVFAAREGENVNFVIEAADIPKEVTESQTTLSQLHFQLTMSVQSTDPSKIAASNCRHLLVSGGAAANDGSSSTVSIGVVTPPRQGAARGLGDLLFRRVNIDLSISRLSSEREPIVAAGLGFQGRATRLSEFIVPASEIPPDGGGFAVSEGFEG